MFVIMHNDMYIYISLYIQKILFYAYLLVYNSNLTLGFLVNHSKEMERKNPRFPSGSRASKEAKDKIQEPIANLGDHLVGGPVYPPHPEK